MSDKLSAEQEYIKNMVMKSAVFVPAEDMAKIQQATVAQAGFGGIGAFILELLARWGIKNFRLLDMDKYEPSNLNRQVFATSKTLGEEKAKAAANRLLEINPYAKIEQIRCERFGMKNAEEFLQGSTIIINGIDFPSGQLPLHYYAKKLRIPVINPHCMHVSAAVVEVFDYRLPSQQSISEPTQYAWLNSFLHNYLHLFKFDEKSLSEERLSQADERFKSKRGGTLNFTTNLAACLAVAETIKLITGKGKQVLYPRQLYFDPYELCFKVRSVYTSARFFNFFKERLSKR